MAGQLVGKNTKVWGTLGYGEGDIEMSRERPEVLERARSKLLNSSNSNNGNGGVGNGSGGAGNGNGGVGNGSGGAGDGNGGAGDGNGGAGDGNGGVGDGNGNGGAGNGNGGAGNGNGGAGNGNGNGGAGDGNGNGNNSGDGNRTTAEDENSQPAETKLGKADTSWNLIGIGFNTILTETENFGLSLVGDVFQTEIKSGKAKGFNSASARSNRVRIGLESTIKYNNGLSLSPSVYLKKDGGDVKDDSELELGLSSDWQVSDKLFLRASGRSNLNNDNKYRSYSLGMEYSPRGKETGSSTYSLDLSDDNNYRLGWTRSLSSGAELNLSADPENNTSQLNYIISF